MTKTEAAETIALDVVVFARRNSLEITKTLVEERMSEARGGHLGGFVKQAADLTCWRSTLRAAKALAR